MSKQGSSVIFLTIILAALISVSLTLVYAARSQAIGAFGDGVFVLACDLVLGRYDYYVHEDYDLFLLRGTDSELSNEFNRCAGYSLDLVADFKNASVNSGRYSTVDVEPVRQQILDYMKAGGAAKLAAEDAGVSGGAGVSDDKSGSGASGNGKTDGSAIEGGLPLRTLRHGPTITSLPSRSLPDKSIITSAETLAENLKNPDAIFNSGTGKYLMDSYILGKFNNDLTPAHGEHFFRGEVEYIICGELSDEDNIRKTDRALKALRTGLNLSHIYSDPEKMVAIEAASQVISPGVLGTVTQAGIAAAWAAVEANNDVLLLHDGYKVPVIKTNASWAIDLDGLINGLSDGAKAIRPSVNQGRNYEDYLRILLFIKDENVKTARILDLIQINMRKNHDRDFLVGECATGFSVDGTVDDRELAYDRVY